MYRAKCVVFGHCIAVMPIYFRASISQNFNHPYMPKILFRICYISGPLINNGPIGNPSPRVKLQDDAHLATVLCDRFFGIFNIFDVKLEKKYSFSKDFGHWKMTHKKSSTVQKSLQTTVVSYMDWAIFDPNPRLAAHFVHYHPPPLLVACLCIREEWNAVSKVTASSKMQLLQSH